MVRRGHALEKAVKYSVVFLLLYEVRLCCDMRTILDACCFVCPTKTILGETGLVINKN